MNQIINRKNNDNFYNLNYPFNENNNGIIFYGPIKLREIIKNNDLDINEFNTNIINEDLFFVDTEGLNSEISKTSITSILTILQIASIKIISFTFFRK